MDIVNKLSESLPTVEPYTLVIIFALAPLGIFLTFTSIYSCFGRKLDSNNHYIPYYHRFTANIPVVYFKFSPIISVLCILWALVICLFQSVFVYNHMGIGTDLQYYLKIDIPAYEAVDLINLAEDSYSLYAYLQGNTFQISRKLIANRDYRQEPASSSKSFQSRLFDLQEKLLQGSSKQRKIEMLSAYQSFISFSNSKETETERENTLSEESGRRRLSPGTSLALIYHTSNWDNILLESNLIAACETERNIRNNVGCINFDGGTSLLSSVFDENTCQFTISYQYALETITLSDNSDYVEDNIDPSNPVSAVLGSLFKMGDCEDISTDSFESQLSAQGVSDTQTVYLSTPFIESAFTDAIINGVYVSAIALIFGSLYILLSVQGIIATFMTIFSILVSVINAAAVLIDFSYGTFSAFNVLSIFILIGVGGNAVVMFGSSWRDVLQPKGITPTVTHFVSCYQKIAQPILFTVCAATISLFSKLISPVIVISQLGAFMGVSVLVFYVCYHIIIIPVWLMTGWFHFPKSFHKKIERQWNKFLCRDKKAGHHHDDGLTDPSRYSLLEDEDERKLDEEEEEENSREDEESISPRPQAYNPNIVTVGGNQSQAVVAAPPAPVALYYETDAEGNSVFILPDEYVNRVSEHDIYFSINNNETTANPDAELSRRRVGARHRLSNNNDPTNNERQMRRQEAIMRKKKLKYAQPSLLKRFVNSLSTNNGEEEENNNNNAPNSSNPSNNRFYSPLLDHGNDGGNYVLSPSSSSQHGLITDQPTVSITPTTVLTAAYPTVIAAHPVGVNGTANPTTIVRVPKRNRKGKWLLKCYGFLLLLLTLGSFGLIGYLVLIKYNLDLGIPQLFPPDSNMGQVLYIVKNYKSSLLTSIDSAGEITVATPSPTQSPNVIPVVGTASPTLQPFNIAPFVITRNPTFAPTPTSRPTIIERHPTLSPSATPSMVPSLAPFSTTLPTSSYTNPPSNGSTDFVDYTVTTCWGLSSYKKYKDSDVNVTYNGNQFMHYVNHGLVNDMQNFCFYVQENRNYLNINPTWNMKQDCIYYQYLEAYNEIYPLQLRNITNALLYWASKTTTSSKLLGMENLNSSNTKNPPIQITWLCANYSARTYGYSSLIDNPDLAESIQSHWDSAFNDYGSVYANQYGIENLIASDEFSFPLLAKEVFLSIELAILISVIGFFGLLVWFSLADLFVIFLGTIGMVAIFAIAICCHLYLYTPTLDLLDVVVLIAIIGIVVDLPIHLILHYTMERSIMNQIRKKWKLLSLWYQEQLDLQQQQRQLQGTQRPIDAIPTDLKLTSEEKRLFSLAIQPELYQTNKYMRFALFQLLILTLICGIPLLFATFVLLQKTGQYIVIIAVVSYAFSILILPYVLAFGFQTNICKRIYRWIRGNKEEVNEDELGGDDFLQVALIQNANAPPLLLEGDSNGGTANNNNNNNQRQQINNNNGSLSVVANPHVTVNASLIL